MVRAYAASAAKAHCVVRRGDQLVPGPTGTGAAGIV